MYNHCESLVYKLFVNIPNTYQAKFHWRTICIFFPLLLLQMLIQYERGYGPLYSVVVDSIKVTEGSCGAEYDIHSLFGCRFASNVKSDSDQSQLNHNDPSQTSNTPRNDQSGSFCAWTNTLLDQDNWVLTDQGII